jgi:HSP20 family molecular chaperone IbpA
MSENNEKNSHCWLKIGIIILGCFIAMFLAFCCAIEVMFHRITDPVYNMHRMEKMLDKQTRDFAKFGTQINEHPFEPKIRPMLVDLVKEPSEYKVIVDLKPLGGDENLVKFSLNDNMVSVSGDMDKNTRHGEEIVNFSQSYYIGEKIKKDKITKEVQGGKYIITIPFEK